MYQELTSALPELLPSFLKTQRWFGGKARKIQSVEIADIIKVPVRGNPPDALILIVPVHYTDGFGEMYAMPLLCVEQSAIASQENLSTPPNIVIQRSDGGVLILSDALANEGFLTALYNAVQQKAVFAGEAGKLHALQTTAYGKLAVPSEIGIQPKVVRAEQSNSSVIYGDRLILKLFRRLEEGTNPDLEVGMFLTEKAHFPHIPQLAGFLEYRSRRGSRMTQGILQAFVPNQGDAWRYTLRFLAKFYKSVLDLAHSVSVELKVQPEKLTADTERVPQPARELVEEYLGSVELLGKRTAELHRALSSDSSDPDFAPEAPTIELQKLFIKDANELTTHVFTLLRARSITLPQKWQVKAEEMLAREDRVRKVFQDLLAGSIQTQIIRIHGDYHLGQILYTGTDFVIIDFEGEPARPLAERRRKRYALQDVAGMLRSFQYAAFALLMSKQEYSTANVECLESWADAWASWTSERFLNAYLAETGSASYLPESRGEIMRQLKIHLLEKAVYELGYELNNRPAWAGLPLEGIARSLSVT